MRSRGGSLTGPCGGDVSRELPRLDADEPKSAAERDLVADEVQSRRAGGLLDVPHERAAALVEDTEVSDKALETGAEAGRGDDRVRLDPSPSASTAAPSFEPLERGDDADAPVRTASASPTSTIGITRRSEESV